MDNEIRVQGPALHTLIPLEDFKAVLSLDDREDALSRYCLITATFTIEHYCKRRLFLKKHFERIEPNGDLLRGPDTFHNDYNFFWPQEPAYAGEVSPYSENRLTGSPALVGVLREYPVREVLAVYAYCSAAEPELYTLCPEREERLDIPHTLRLSPALGRLPGVSAFKAVYRAGYRPGKAPADLTSACLELAMWNMSRYRGRFYRGSGYQPVNETKRNGLSVWSVLWRRFPSHTAGNWRNGTTMFSAEQRPRRWGEEPTLSEVVDRAVLTRKKYIPPKHPGTGEIAL